jgi:hypothetical protein
VSEIVENMQEVNQEVDLAPEAHEDAGALSFDELDSLTDGRSEEKILNDVKKEIKTETKKNEPKAKAEDHDEEADLGAKAEEGESEAFKEEIKRIMAKQGEEELELAANTLFRQKVDGEEVDVDLQELLNNYSGKISYDKKFQELSDQKKQYESDLNQYKSEMDEVNSYINNFADKIKNNDALGALEYFAQFSGMKPYEFRRELLNQLAPEVDRIRNMSPDQQKVEELNMQTEYLQRQQESAQQHSQQQQALRELELEIETVQEAHGISTEDFSSAFENLKDSGYDGQITPQVVADFYLNSQAFSRADEILSSVDESLSQNEQVVETLQNIIMENPSFDNDDLLEIVNDVFGAEKKKISKSVSRKAITPQKQEKKEPRKQEEYVDWDDF